mmetsp:Transcript_59215/g.171664  ORF Transcript_59215/g.171664 Transcript_59215/m.171664 type:complete len:232 (+) Transcript_59215:1033-1728(+)
MSIVASSALSTSTSAGDSFSSTSATSFCAAVRCTNSCRTVFRGLSLFWAACSCCCSFPSSETACAFADSLSNLLQLACLAFRNILASPMAFCASCAACSVCVTACLTSSRSSPAASIISEVIAAFSTASSAVFVFCTASGRSSDKACWSRSSEAFCFIAAVALALEARSFASSVLTRPCAPRMTVPMVANCRACSPPEPRCASMILFMDSLSLRRCGWSRSSAAWMPSEEL